MSSLDSTQSRIAAQLNAFKVAAIQMASGPKVEGNLSEARRLIAKAAEQGAKLVVLPEFFAIMGMNEQDKVKVRELPGQGPIQSFLSEMARKHKIWLVGGSIPLAANTPDKVRNSLLVFDETGAQVARYDKIHLFNLTLGNESYNEAQTIEPGDKVVVVDSPFGRIGLAICYDLRFPELFRAMKDVNIIVLPSAFTATTGKVHWEPLVRARAIENLSYVIAAAQGGYHVSGRETHGHSMIVDPWGRVMDELQRGSGVVIADVNPSYQASLRSSLPALSHRTLSCNT
ncbi:carbon-nitrogen hydrolase family protein [Sideroxydans lithotrophicus]|uniref:Nitrilase/cyanide hydratase and apolipoprotein N-acyltransferase n=1 Tax=Sideroxydans lithotrophicus (strain ES-1) TaxID=580332 RepID=D5CU10_SIDLE|nr:carbon-nitrogen hydrolase family protein [Sideroxydans lithotrophicus]ADE12322.1 Nitrilase/cyanide hydratase and apolipoprotein N-acyltransferase [Sideroxydans lithotrophicus ES-1]